MKTHKQDKDKLLNEIVDLKIQLNTTSDSIGRMETKLKEINQHDKENRKSTH